MQTSAAQFATQKYLTHPSMLDASGVVFHYRYALSRAAGGTMTLKDSQVPSTPSAYGDPIMETLLEELRPAVERATGLSLFPTYAYFRIYKHGDVLERHRDRPSCEISMTLALGGRSDEPWPIWIEGAAGPAAVPLKPGDVLIYRGCECDHWREAFAGEHAAQVFLHYVDQNGPNAEWKFDKRPALASLVKSETAASSGEGPNQVSHPNRFES
jgi:hypothetical protein